MTLKTDKMVKRLDKIAKAQAPKKVKAKARAKTKPAKAVRKKVAKKAAKLSAIDTVLTIIEKSRNKKGISAAALRKKTGFDDNKIRGIVFRLKQQGKIKSGGRGFYLKA